MKANIATLRSQLSKILKKVVEKGEILEIQKRNVTIAKIIPFSTTRENKTRLGSGSGSVTIKADLTDSVLDDEWDMHK